MRRELFACATVIFFLTAITLAVFWQTIGYGFTNYDDNGYVTDNPYVHAGLTAKSLKWALVTEYEATWQPVVWVSYFLDRTLFGMKPQGFHLTNILLHLTNVLLLLLVLRKMTGCLWRSAFVAALFAVHPLHVESVAWIAERKGLLSSLFWLLAMLSYTGYVEKPCVGKYLLVALAFVLGLMAKPMLVTLPFALLLLDIWPLSRVKIQEGGRELWASCWPLVLEKVPLFVLSAIFSVVAYMVQKQGGAVSSLARVSIDVRITNAITSYVTYLQHTVWPADLAVIYPHLGTDLPESRVLTSVIILLLTSIVIFHALPARPFLTTGWLWFIGTLCPVIGLIPFGVQMMADRFTYIPLIGVFVMVAWGIPSVFASKNVLAIGSIITVLASAGAAYIQTGYWSDSVTLFKRALEVTQNNPAAHSQLGVALRAQGDLAGAIDHYREALRINPQYLHAQGNLANALMDSERADEAVQIFRQMLQSRPGDFRTITNLGMALKQTGQINEAIRWYQEAVRLAPNYVAGRRNLGNALLQTGRIDEAISQYFASLQFDQGDPDVHHNLAIAFYSKGSYDLAWREVHLCKHYGGSPAPKFLKLLVGKMPDPWDVSGLN